MMFSDSMLCASSSLAPSFKNLGALFNGGATDGLMIDLTDTTTLFQDANGAAAVVSNGNPIGLALDQHKWGGKTLAEYRAVQPELITNGAFDTDVSGWTVSGTGATLTWVSGVARLTSVNTAGPYFYQTFSTVVGRWYEVTFDLVAQTGTAGAHGVRVGTTNLNGANLNTSFTTNGTYRYWFKATATTTYFTIVARPSASTSDFDNISVKEIDGHHATQTASARPTWASATSDVRFDGSDDYLITDYKPPTSQTSQFLAGYGKTTSTGSNMYIAGSYGGSSTSRFAVGKRSTNGADFVAGGNIVVDSDPLDTNYNTIIGDRGSSLDELFLNGIIQSSAGINGGVNTNADMHIGAWNSGSLNSFWNGYIKRIVAGPFHLQDVMSATDFHENLIN